MLAETVQVTDEAISIRQLLATARSCDLQYIPAKATTIMLKYSKSEIAIIYLKDPVSGQRPASVTGVTVLDASNEDLVGSTYKEFDLDLSLLQGSVAGPTSVEVIINQHR